MKRDLASEHPFPAPLEDALMVWLHLCEGRLTGLSSERLAVAGDRAGGTLAAGLCVALRERGLAQPYLQALVYPVLSAHQHFASMREHACAPMLTTQGLMASLAGYVPDEPSQRDPSLWRWSRRRPLDWRRHLLAWRNGIRSVIKAGHTWRC